jgi:ketosteroid isomerase-like protein
VARTTALLACALLAFAACGGGSSDREDVEQTLRDFVTALNTRDADRFCDDLVTREFIEKQTLAKGDRALADCKRQLRQVKDLKVELVRISSLKVEGDRARAKAVLSVKNQESDQLYRLRKEDGGWRIASGSGG